MRWKALYILAGLAILFWVVGTCFGGFILKWSLENSLETVTGARVDVSSVSLNLIRLGVRIGDIQIANPNNTWRNLIQAKDIRFQADPIPLLYGKIVIEEIAVEELMINTKRKTDGKLNRPLLPGPFGAAQAILHESIAGIPVLKAGDMAGQFNVDELLKNYSFDLDLSAVDIESKLEKLETRWESSEAELDKIKVTLKQNEEKLRSLKSGDLKNPLVIREKVETVKEVKQSLKDVEKTVKTSRDSFREDVDGIRSTISNMKDVADGDYQKIIKMANVPNPKQMDITEALLGKDILNQSTVMLNLVSELQAMVPVKVVNPPKKKHVRGGQDIVFPGRKTYPRLLIKRIHVSGQGNVDTELEGFTAQASVEGVTSEPVVYGKPMVFAVNATAGKLGRLDVTGQIDRTRPDYQDQFHARVFGFPVPELPMPKDNKYLPTSIQIKSTEVKTDLTLSQNEFLLEMTVEGRDLVGNYQGRPEPEDLIQEIIREALAEFDLISLSYRLQGIGKELEMDLTSNLDDVVRERIKTIIGRKLDEFFNSVRAKVETKLQKKQAELNAKLDKGQRDLETKLAEAQEKLSVQLQESEELKKKLEAELEKTKGKLKLPDIGF